MEDSAIKYFFSSDGSDKRGVQVATAMSSGRLSDLIQNKNFVRDPRLASLNLFDNDVHPEACQFFVLVGEYHKAIFSTPMHNVMTIGNLLSRPDIHGHLLVKNAIMNNAALSTNDKVFFDKYINLVHVSATGAVDAEKSINELVPTDDLSAWSLNLRKSNSGPTAGVRFADELPNTAVTKLFGINGITGTYTVKSLYEEAYMGTVSSDPANLLGNPRVGFGIDLMEFIKARLEKSKQITEDSGDDLPNGSLLDFVTGDIIDVRDGKFIAKDGSRVSPLSFTADNCYTTQVQGTKEQCNRLISELILNEDADAFNRYFSKFDDSLFALKARDDIAKIHPDMAVAIIKKFGFEILSTPTSGRPVKKVQSISSWISSLAAKGASKEVITNILSANHLKTYLEALVHFINNNPAILNSGLTDAVVDDDEMDPESYLGRTKIAMIPRMPLGEPSTDKHDALLKIATNVSMAHRLLAMPASLPFPFPVMRLPGMVGGAIGSSATLRPIIRGLISDLSRKGKKLRASDQSAIENHLNTLDKLEKALVKVSQQLNDFRDWTNILPDNRTGTVSLGTIEDSLDKYRQDSIDKYRQCVARHANMELGLINVAIKLCEE